MRLIKSYKVFELFRGKLRYIGPNPTADTTVTRVKDGKKEVLLVQRSNWVAAEPGKWSIPGGFVDTNAKPGGEWKQDMERPIDAAKREVLEETGLDLSNIPDSEFILIGIYDSMERDPRNTDISWVKSHSFTVEIPGDMGNDVSGMDDAQNARWFNLEELNSMNPEEFAFDHLDRLIDLGFYRR